ncbi:hypothetical protein BMETH_1977_0 [methanotrophic bacterial endosymbiont of Bathymodiolus sp.]|nr:hypothetical protein BMETH_1977_0 [methanotrophic bacterial endosymbiont of Bathymodiolus sp.]
MRCGGPCRKTNAEQYSRRNRTTLKSAWPACPKLPDSFTTLATWANRLIF